MWLSRFAQVAGRWPIPVIPGITCAAANAEIWSADPQIKF